MTANSCHPRRRSRSQNFRHRYYAVVNWNLFGLPVTLQLQMYRSLRLLMMHRRHCLLLAWFYWIA